MRPLALFAPLLSLSTLVLAGGGRRKATIPHPYRASHEAIYGQQDAPGSLSASVTANATLRASLEKHCTRDVRAQWVAHVRELGKEGKISAQWYPGYNAYLLPVDQIDFSTVNLLFWFVQITEQGGLNATVEGPLDELVLYAGLHGIPVVATVGGWDGGLWFSTIMQNKTGREDFIAQISEFVDDHFLSGWEIDWEYPGSTNNIGCNNVSKKDTQHLGEFFKELRAELGDDMLITLDVGSGGLLNATGGVDYELAEWSEPVDYFNIMNYDTYGSWSGTTGPNAPLADACNGGWSKVGAIDSVAIYTAAGVPKAKLIMGMPGYGYSYILKETGLNTTYRKVEFVNGTKGELGTQLYQEKYKQMPEGDLTDAEGIDVCGNNESWSGIYLYKSLITYGFLSADGTQGLNNFTRYWDECSSTPFLYTETNNTFISYDDASSLAIKTSWAQDEGIAGVNIFDSTGPTRDLLEAVKLATEDRAALWSRGIMTVENATVLFDRPKDP